MMANQRAADTGAELAAQEGEKPSMNTRARRVVIVTGVLITTAAAPARAATKCTMVFSLSGWSAIYKRASGSGTITCDNGQSAAVSIRTTGGGLTFGKSKVVNGRGTFSDVGSIGELFGNYATADVHAGAVRSSDAQVLTRGTVSLALAGTGEGVGIGFDFGKFTISRAGAAKKKK
jgi:hypothetical protein